MLRALCLDLMDTVVHDPYVEALEAATGMSVAEVRQVADPASWPAFERGAIGEEEFVRRFYTDPGAGHRFDIDAFHAVRLGGYRFLPGMERLLDAAAGRLERYLASNYPVWIEELGRRFGFAERFEGVFASHAAGVRKPDPAFYAALLDVVGRPAGQCLFVDDRLDNCEAAEMAGMRAHRFQGAEDLAARLRREGVALPASWSVAP